MDKFELTINKDDLVVLKEGYPVLAEEVESILDDVQTNADEANALLANVREAILAAMVDNNIYNCKVGKYSISQVLGRDKVIFDKESFFKDAPEDIVMAFTTLEKSEPVFNLEKFKAENPELYAKYLESEDIIVVDEKKLEKTLPEVYEKYVSRVKSDKKPTIMIKQSKEKKK